MVRLDPPTAGGGATAGATARCGHGGQGDGRPTGATGRDGGDEPRQADVRVRGVGDDGGGKGRTERGAIVPGTGGRREHFR